MLVVGEEDANDPIRYDLYRKEEIISEIEEYFGKGPVMRAKNYSRFMEENSVPMKLEVLHGQNHILDISQVHANIYKWFEMLDRGKTE